MEQMAKSASGSLRDQHVAPRRRLPNSDSLRVSKETGTRLIGKDPRSGDVKAITFGGLPQREGFLQAIVAPVITIWPYGEQPSVASFNADPCFFGNLEQVYHCAGT